MRFFRCAFLVSFVLAWTATAASDDIVLGTEMLFDNGLPRVTCKPIDCQSMMITRVTCNRKGECVSDTPRPSAITRIRMKCDPSFPYHCGVRVRTVTEEDHRNLISRVELIAIFLVCMCAVAGVSGAFLCARRLKKKE